MARATSFHSDRDSGLSSDSRRGSASCVHSSRMTWLSCDTVVMLTTPKSGRLRYVPLTHRLTAALVDHRHLRSKRVLCQADGSPFTRQIVQNRMILAARRANVKKGVHILRHTFCSHLSMRGAPARAIQELAGHADLTMTQRYMHLSPAALEAAIKLLDEPRLDRGLGVIERQV